MYPPTTIGVQLVRWYQMGITDYSDLQWLLLFYHNLNYPTSIVGGCLTHSLTWMREREIISS